MEFTLEEKLKYVDACRKNQLIPLDPKCRCSVKRWHRRVRDWAKLFDLFGSAGLAPKRKHKSYSPEEKARIVERVMGGESRGEVARSLGIEPSLVASWVNPMRNPGPMG